MGINLHLTSSRSLILRYYSEIYLEGLRKIANSFFYDTPFPGRELNPRILEEDAGVVNTLP
jgi:hypothetical protein